VGKIKPSNNIWKKIDRITKKTAKYKLPPKLIAKSIQSTSCLSKIHYDSQTQDFLSRKGLRFGLVVIAW
jgi:hypothetical protein